MPQYGCNPRQILVDHGLRLPLDLHLAVVEEDGPLTKADDASQVVRYEDDRDTLRAQPLDVVEDPLSGSRHGS